MRRTRGAYLDLVCKLIKLLSTAKYSSKELSVHLGITVRNTNRWIQTLSCYFEVVEEIETIRHKKNTSYRPHYWIQKGRGRITKIIS